MKLKIKRVEIGKIIFPYSEEIFLNVVKYISIFTHRSERKKKNQQYFNFLLFWQSLASILFSLCCDFYMA